MNQFPRRKMFAKDRRRRRRLIVVVLLVAFLAGFAYVAVGPSDGALFAGGQWFGKADPASPSQQARSSKQLDPLPLVEGGIAVGGEG